MITGIDVDRVLTGLKASADRAANEEEFKINAERVIYNEVLEKLGLQPGRYEYTFVSGGRADALYGHLIIEYENPKKYNLLKAKEQVINYIKKEAGGVEARFPSFIGVILCDKIAFVRYDLRSKDWVLRGPYDLNRESVLRLIEAIRGLRRKKLCVDELLRDFGPESELARRVVTTLYRNLLSSKNPKVEALFNDWKKLFSQVCAYSPEKLKGLEADYGFKGQVDYSALLFAIHTYYAFLMKLLGAEIAYLYGTGKFLKSYVAELEDAYMRGLNELKRALEELESGGVFKRLLNITNFVEGDYFSWYLEELDWEVAEALCEVAKRLADYEPATPVLEPEYTRDMLKRLYQNLVPKRIRHDLGEYYTPDWLADLVLDEAGLTVERFEEIAKEKDDPLAPLSLRVLDPACGSGTFLVLLIKRFKEYAENHYLKDVLAEYLLKNIVGFDLNPLAVLTSRTNYLLAIADLLMYIKGSIEIPIYLADSLLVEARRTLTGTSYVITHYVGEFELPKSVVDKGLLNRLLDVIERCVRLKYKPEEFKQLIQEGFGLSQDELSILVNLYGKFLKLEEEGKNHVWTSIIRNAFAPLTIVSSYGRFDYVVGNPPWINWESLPEDYREKTKNIWGWYGLLEKTKGMGLGKVKRDMAMLFLARCLDRFVKNSGRLAFLIPFTVYKTQAGAGFRKFLARGYWKSDEENSPCKVIKIHDLVTLFPFEGAVNRTSLIVIDKSERTTFPILCITWHNPASRGIDQDATLEEVRIQTKRFDMIFIPVEVNKPESPWMQITEKAYEGIKKVFGSSPWYEAHAGVYTGLNQVYWIKIISETPDGLLITNPPLPGQKKEVRQVEQVVEKDLVYPLIRGRDVKKWYVEGGYGNIIIPHYINTGRPIPESELKIKYPKIYEYFYTFRNELKNRSIHKLWGRENPFYSVYDIGKYTFSSYKVVWKRIAGAITGKAISFASAVLEPYKERAVIPNDSLILIPFNNKEEAYYVAGILNSSVSLLTIASYTYELRQETHITQYIRIPKFDKNNDKHVRISDLSEKAHILERQIREGARKDLRESLRQVEEEIDKLVSILYGITDEELSAIKECLEILKEGELEEEIEEETLEPINLEPDVSLDNPVIQENTPSKLVIVVKNPLDEAISNVRLKVQALSEKHEYLFDKIEKQEICELQLAGLKAGKYEFRVSMDYFIRGENKKIEKTLTLFVKSSGEKRAVERGGIDDLF
ncbi:MAG: class I SAM-dependent DNA methyltransferase [Candidatus Bathyarchaeia archaeon]